FFACLVILFACEVAAGIWGFMHRDTVSKEMINYYDSVFDKATAEGVMNREKGHAAASVLKVFHETLNCCGKGQGTSFATRISDAFGFTDLCPKSQTDVSAIMSVSSAISTLMHQQLGHT
ncbi:CD81 antigen-like, partial [Plectropomus leopardus]|uniref:CD81 antigen-like n=1 Tax=Plectropomus leopardus TaxID=160734 RepID=UPI001C4D9ED4